MSAGSGEEKKDFFGGSDLAVELKLVRDFMLDETNPNDLRVRLMHQAFKDKTGIIVFYSPTCPACHMFKPTVQQLANTSKGMFPVGAVNCRDMVSGNQLLEEYVRIKAYPTIKFYKDGEFLDYDGKDRKVSTIMKKICELEGICDDATAAAVGMSPSAFFGGGSDEPEARSGGDAEEPVERSGGRKWWGGEDGDDDDDDGGNDDEEEDKEEETADEEEEKCKCGRDGCKCPGKSCDCEEDCDCPKCKGEEKVKSRSKSGKKGKKGGHKKRSHKSRGGDEGFLDYLDNIYGGDVTAVQGGGSHGIGYVARDVTELQHVGTPDYITQGDRAFHVGRVGGGRRKRKSRRGSKKSRRGSKKSRRSSKRSHKSSRGKSRSGSKKSHRSKSRRKSRRHKTKDMVLGGGSGSYAFANTPRDAAGLIDELGGDYKSVSMPFPSLSAGGGAPERKGLYDPMGVLGGGSSDLADRSLGIEYGGRRRRKSPRKSRSKGSRKVSRKSSRRRSKH